MAAMITSAKEKETAKRNSNVTRKDVGARDSRSGGHRKRLKRREVFPERNQRKGGESAYPVDDGAAMRFHEHERRCRREEIRESSDA